jgi:hypothetical protein
MKDTTEINENDNGTYTVIQTLTTKKRTKYKNVMEFKPSTESHGSRDLESQY